MLTPHLSTTCQNRDGGRIVGDAFEHQRRRAVGERTVDDVAVAGDPADIRRAPVDVVVVIVEHVLVGHRGEHQVAAGGVQYPLRLAGRTGGIEDEQRILGAHLDRRADVADLGEFVLQPHVAAVHPADLAAGAADHQHLLAARRLGQCLVGIGLQRNDLATPHAFVGGDDEFRVAVDDASGEAIGRKSTEHHRMDSADAGAGEHRIGSFRDHRQVDGDAVALLDAVRLHHVGETADALMQLPVGDLGIDGRIIAFPDDGDLIAARFEMAIDAVGGDVEGAVLVPFDRDVVGCKAGILHPRIGLDPVDAAAVLAPESFRIGDTSLVHGEVGLVVDPRAFGELPGDVVDLLLRHAPFILPRRQGRFSL